jgi:hypothetical protein
MHWGRWLLLFPQLQQLRCSFRRSNLHSVPAQGHWRLPLAQLEQLMRQFLPCVDLVSSLRYIDLLR